MTSARPPGPATAPPRPDRYGPGARTVLWTTLLACTAVELTLQLADRGLIGSPRWRALAYDYGAFWPSLLGGGWQPNYALQPWTMFLSYALLHGGLWHLAMNMVTLWSLGRAVGERAGARGLVALMAAGVLGGAVAQGLLAAGPAPMVGASGGLFGLAGGLLRWSWAEGRAQGLSQRPVLIAAAVLLGLNLAMWWALAGQLAWQAHLGGFVLGALLAPDPPSPEP
ncbi:rhomboid family intramembrane serine protease [Jannaschia formosa]|uniref:rhomboid family intramembrane serine protease n=1 Tax=Jannaschia formosa TaxID=2259592 RepID=UPI000E1C1A76|nr:rhomboid family intramembrane serine protease [Jannaschia formosa]TFL17118.1 rhomboid family intramembrane serine protease [Jannaschia formosa]